MKCGRAAGAALILAACTQRYEPPPAPEPLRPHPNSIAAQLAGDWRHDPPVSPKQFGQDKAACRAFSALVPDGQGSPGFAGLVAYLNCLKSKGYTPISPQ